MDCQLDNVDPNTGTTLVQIHFGEGLQSLQFNRQERKNGNL